MNNQQKPVATMKLKSIEDQQRWLKGLNQHVEDHRRWRNAAENCLSVMTPGSIRNSFLKGFRQGSLYDQTPIIGEYFWTLEIGLNNLRYQACFFL